MTAIWSMGVPQVRKDVSDVVEVTDGTMLARARYRPAGQIWETAAWVHEDGKVALMWRPTHWRTAPPIPKPPAPSDLVFEID
ncbi:hypothetical protein [Bosea sp. PAMC 26642]|uniref:hypothetical protein n=1 Tax=Bosea sp. (strain PAMC 26642) TaxID=1792307 RepID=UPI00077050CF|nr:hypothetical protein [Bosea sp. PAMC 26642]AMJ60950.1 hypothetical protein AXW83_12170 [Bosea sp. PAMC 26642]